MLSPWFPFRATILPRRPAQASRSGTLRTSLPAWYQAFGVAGMEVLTMLLVGERVKLREYRQTDVPVIQKWVNDPEVNRYIAFWVRPYSLPETEKLVESQLTQDPTRGVGLVICLKDDPEETYIGGCGLNKVNLTHAEFNERGHRCYLACGFREEGRIRQRIFRDGRFWDELQMGITRDEYPATGQSPHASGQVSASCGSAAVREAGIW